MHNETLKHPLPKSLMHMINNDIQRKNATYLPAQSPAHKINDKNTAKILLQQSIAYKSNVEILKEKYKKISVLLQQLTYEINDETYFLQEPWKSASAVLSCKISYKTQSNNLKNLPPQSLRSKSIENKKM